MAWLTGWTYRKEITLSRASGAVTNYQMKLLVGESAGAVGENVDCNSHILSNFDDLRFTAADGTTVLDYWIESITGTTPNRLATVWIEFDSIETGATTFYMYYGKTDAVAYSDGGNTFLLFDHFLGSSLDLAKWNKVGTVTVTGSTAATTGNGNANYFSSISSYATSSAYRLRVSTKSTGAYGRMGFIASAEAVINNGNTAQKIGFQNDGNTALFANFCRTTNSQADVGNTDANYHLFDFLWLPASPSAQILYDGASLSTVTDTVFVPNATLLIKLSDALTTDWIFVSLYSATEPAWGSWGSEEEEAPPPSGTSFVAWIN